MKRLTRIMVSLLSLAIFVNFFLFRVFTPLSAALLMLGLCSYIIIVAEWRHKSMFLLFVTCVYTVFTLWMRAAHFIQAQGVLAIITLTASLWYTSISESESYSSFTAVFLSPFFAGLTYMKRAFVLIKPSTLSACYRKGVVLLSDRQKHSHIISTIIGLAIALPIMLILVSMFATADPIYYSYLKKILSPAFLQELPWRIVFSFFIIGVITPIVFPRIRRIFVSPGQILGRFQMAHELTIVMAVVALVIASFIIIQWPYVFVNVRAETDLSRFGVATYAEYVKKGFIELLRVSAFIYALLWLGLTALRQGTKKNNRALSILQWVVIGEFFIILLSIARRVYLYQMYHGLTLIRVYGSFFLVWLGMMTVMLAVRHITSKLRFGYIEGIITLFIFIFLGTWNVEQFIVAVHPPTVNKHVDYVYLSRLSADGVDGWVEAYNHAKQVTEKYENTNGEIDRNGRREIAYVEYIINRMTYQYYDYMVKYAPSSEMRAYIDTIVDFQKKRLEKEHDGLTEYRKTVQDKIWVTDRIKENERIQKNIEKIKAESLTEVILPENANCIESSDISIDSWQRLKMFDSVASPVFLSFYTSYNRMYCPNDSYPNYETVATRYTKITSLDRLYSKNMSDINAFQVMKQSIPLSELHILQEKYYDLYTRIGKQSARDYDVDISLESPLL